MDRLTSLTVFGRVVESGGFSAAARRLNMSATMVSSHVQALEDRLGARLLNRTTRKVSLTEIGRLYYERTVQILADLEDADRMAGTLQAAPRGTLRLYTSGYIGRFLGPVLSEALTRFPDLAIELTTGERMIDMVEEGFDLVIRTLPPPDSSLIVRQLTPWRHILCASPGYLAGRAAPVTPDEVAGHNCLQYAFYPYGDDWRFEHPDGHVVSVRVGGNYVTNNADTLRYLTLSGHGLFLAPGFVVGEDIRAGRLVRLMPAYRPPEFAICAIYPHRHHLSAKVRSFIDLLADRFTMQRQQLDPGEPGQ